MTSLGFCLSLAALSSGSPLFIPSDHFTLAWTHSIEKVRWEEDYRIVQPNTAGPPELLLERARIQGSAAGMEPPDDAVLRNGWYEYHPVTPTPSGLRLTRSVHTADYDICFAGQCRPMGELLASDGDITWLRPCTTGHQAPASHNGTSR